MLISSFAARDNFGVVNQFEEIQNPWFRNYHSPKSMSEFEEWIRIYPAGEHCSDFIPIIDGAIWIGVLIQPNFDRAVVLAPYFSATIQTISDLLGGLRLVVEIERVLADVDHSCSENDSGVVVLAALYLQIQCCPAIFPLNPRSIKMFRNFFSYHFIQSRLPWL